MVLLTMTPSIMDGLAKRGEVPPASDESKDGPSLVEPAIGKPISHDQIVKLWRHLQAGSLEEYTLEALLKGSRVYVPPPPPKPEPSAQYKALMARLRREDEQRAYERMVNPPQPHGTFARGFPGGGGASSLSSSSSHSAANMARAFAAVNRPERAADTGDDADAVTLNDVHRQVMVIVNVGLSIVGVAATLWVVARWWSTPARLALSMAGGMLVGIAEVALYSGYLWHLGEEKKKEKKGARGYVKEVKEVRETWAVGGQGDVGITATRNSNGEKPAAGDNELLDRSSGAGANLRRRQAEPLHTVPITK